MALSVSALNGVKVYNLSAGKTLPEWHQTAGAGNGRDNSRSLRYNEEYRRRLELIQDFTFPTSSSQIALSSDARYVIACGVYRPQVKVFELDQLGLKLERHSDAEIVSMQILSDDYTKLALLRADRTVELHAKYGLLHSVRIPKFGRTMAYNGMSCDLMMGGSGSELWRLNLELGQFTDAFQTEFNEINKVDVNRLHQLVGLAGDQNMVEFWDPRDRTRSATLHIQSDHQSTDAQITALHFAMDGLTFVAGTSTGHCLVYDLRSSRPLLDKDHRNGLPIRDLSIHERSRQIVSTDGVSIKIWNRQTASPFTTIQATAPINQLCLVPDSGVLFAAAEQHRIPAYYIPDLGPAPRWCSFLDNLTEELEEDVRTSSFDDYKFVTRSELTQLGLNDLIGTNMLRAYMHGFFMDMRLWRKVKSVADPFAYETFMKKKVQEKIEARRHDRITVARRLPKVNRDYAEALLQANPKQTAAENPLGDDRFQAMFKDAEFAIDKECDEFRRLKAANAKLDGPKETPDQVKRFSMADESDSDPESGNDSDDPFSMEPRTRRRTRKQPLLDRAADRRILQQQQQQQQKVSHKAPSNGGRRPAIFK